MSDEPDNLLPPLPAAPNPERALHDAIVADTRARMADFTAMLSADGITPQRALRLIGVYAESQRTMLRTLAISRDTSDMEDDPAGEHGGLGPALPPIGQRYNAQTEIITAASAMFDKIAGPQVLTGLTGALREAKAVGDMELVAKLRRKIDQELGLDEPVLVASPLAPVQLTVAVTSTGVKDAPRLADGWRYATDEEIEVQPELRAVCIDGSTLVYRDDQLRFTGRYDVQLADRTIVAATERYNTWVDYRA